MKDVWIWWSAVAVGGAVAGLLALWARAMERRVEALARAMRPLEVPAADRRR